MATGKAAAQQKASVRSLSKQLSSLSSKASGVASTAKAQGKDTTGITNAINKSNAMVAQTERQGSRSFSGSREEANYNANVITPQSTAVTPTINIPTPVQTVAPDVSAMNTGLAGGETGVTNTNGILTPDPITQQALDSGSANFQKLMDSITTANEERTTGADIQRKLEKESGLKQYRQQVNDYTSQINNIVANRDATVLSLTGQGRGIPEAIIGGQQAQVNKEAAIKALPIQALLANAQGNLDSAREYINTWGSVLVNDANNAYNNKVKTIEAVYNFATAQDKIKLDSLQAQQKEKKDAAIALATAKTNAIKQALAQPGGNAVVQAITMATDENGVAAALGQFNGDVLGNQVKLAQLRELNAPKVSAPIKRDTQVVDGKLIDMQTGEVITDIGAGTAPDMTLKLAGSKSNIDQIGSVLKSGYISGAVGPNRLARMSPLSAFTGGKGNIVSSVEQIRGQLTVDNLINAKAQGATFGALSGEELKLLNASATQLGTWAVKDKAGNVVGYNTSEGAFRKEMDKINNFAKLDYIIKGGAPEDIDAVVKEDNTVWVLNSDGTYTQLK